MNRVKLFLICCLFFSFFLKAENNILEKSDKAFFPEMSNFDMKMTIYEQSEMQKYYVLNCYLKGHRKYMVLFQDPPIVRRRAHLRVDNDIWEYLGKIKKSFKLSAKASFAGGAFSEEDILSVSLGYYYNLEKTEETLENDHEMIKLSLVSPSKETAYYKIDAYIDAETYLPIKRYYYSFSGEKIKELKIDELKKDKSGLSYVKMTMTDLLRKGVYTIVEMQSFKNNIDLNDRMFSKKYMEIACE